MYSRTGVYSKTGVLLPQKSSPIVRLFTSRQKTPASVFRFFVQAKQEAVLPSVSICFLKRPPAAGLRKKGDRAQVFIKENSRMEEYRANKQNGSRDQRASACPAKRPGQRPGQRLGQRLALTGDAL